MAKQGEIEYLAKLGPEGVEHARGKPFTDEDCGGLLANLAGVFMVLPPPPAKVLDLGCGSGWTSVFLARRGYDVLGQDIAGDMVSLAESNRVRAGLTNLCFVVSDYESLGLDGEFDAALFHDALHHAVDPEAALACAWRALKPGGLLVTVEPGAGHGATEGARNAVAEYGVTERDMPPPLIAQLAGRVGFRRARVYPMPRTLAALHYQSRSPRWWPQWLSSLYAPLATAWVTVVGRRHYGAMMVLVK
jgi:SAM-dependent methyltransferase